MRNTYFPLRYVARIIVEAKTPLTIGTGVSDLVADNIVALDVNGLPMIPGTSLCGVLRNLAKSEVAQTDNIFGYQKSSNNEGLGSRIIISDALMIGENGEIHDGLSTVEWSTPFYRKFRSLPIRDHCRINHLGTADVKSGGKFGEQVVYKGARFLFEIELIGEREDIIVWQQLLSLLKSPIFRVGGGTRKGFGSLSVKSVKTKVYDLSVKSELESYLDKSSCLSEPFTETKDLTKSSIEIDTKSYTKYQLILVPDDFYMFGSGTGDSDADQTYKMENVITWDSVTNEPKFSVEMILIPASSVKGALSHRVAFHYNQAKHVFALPEVCKNYNVESNEAVRALFGYALNSSVGEQTEGRRGIIIFSDVFCTLQKDKIFDHVSLDRFTGGALNGALFNEKVIAGNNEIIKLEILIPNNAYQELDSDIITAFEKALKDISTGLLPLGGSVMKGHGCFTGSVILNGRKL